VHFYSSEAKYNGLFEEEGARDRAKMKKELLLMFTFF
jgi:hypothetical protein